MELLMKFTSQPKGSYWFVLIPDFDTGKQKKNPLVHKKSPLGAGQKSLWSRILFLNNGQDDAS